MDAAPNQDEDIASIGSSSNGSGSGHASNTGSRRPKRDMKSELERWKREKEATTKLPAAGAGSPPPLVPSLATVGGLQRRPATPQRRAPTRPIANTGAGAPQSVRQSQIVWPHGLNATSAPSGGSTASHRHNSSASTAAALGRSSATASSSSSRLLVPNQLCYGVSKTPSPVASNTSSPEATLQQADGEPQEHESCIVTPNSSKMCCPRDVTLNLNQDALSQKLDKVGYPAAPPPTPEKKALSAKLSEALVNAASSAHQRVFIEALVPLLLQKTGSEQSSQTPVTAAEVELASPIRRQQQQQQKQQPLVVLEDGTSSEAAPATPSEQRYQQQTSPGETKQHQRLHTDTSGEGLGSCCGDHDSRHEMSPLSLESLMTSSPARASPPWRDQQGLSPLLATIARPAATSW